MKAWRSLPWCPCSCTQRSVQVTSIPSLHQDKEARTILRLLPQSPTKTVFSPYMVQSTTLDPASKTFRDNYSRMGSSRAQSTNISRSSTSRVLDPHLIVFTGGGPPLSGCWSDLYHRISSMMRAMGVESATRLTLNANTLAVPLSSGSARNLGHGLTSKSDEITVCDV